MNVSHSCWPLAVGLWLVCGFLSANAASKATETFPLTDVRLLPSPFYDAQQTNIEQLLSYDVARFTAPFWREAGLKPQAPSYGNWENTGLDGHMAGHYLSALSLAYAATGDHRLSIRLQQMLDALWQAQKAQGDGYLGGIPQGKAMWAELRRGVLRVDAFSVNERWVPLYNLHKTMAGLRDAYQLTQNQMARSMWLLLGDWWLKQMQGLSHAQLQQLVQAEPGGINESMVDLYQETGNPQFLALAKSLSDQTLLTRLSEGAAKAIPPADDGLTGMHANTQIPKVLGFWRIGRVSNDVRYQQAARWFFQTVSQDRSTAIGGNSVREHFHQQHDFSAMLSSAEGPETCNSYNMLKLAKALFEATGESRYLTFYERTNYNHILSSQHPVHGGKVYFTPIKPGHYRVYSSHEQSMWCCVGSGIENHSKYAELIYSHQSDVLQVNQFIPSQLNWRSQGVTLTLTTRFPDDEQVQIQIQQSTPTPWTLQVRQSDWLASRDGHWQLNGKPVTADEQDGYASIRRIWHAGDSLRFVRTAKLYTQALPDGSGYLALLYGPVVLASPMPALPTDDQDTSAFYLADDSRMGHIASGASCPVDKIPVFVGDSHQLLQSLTRQPSEQLRYLSRVSNTAGYHQLQQQTAREFVPFFRVHDSRYLLYSPVQSAQAYPKYVEVIKHQQQELQQLEARTLDQIQPGEQQPEVEHQLQGQQMSTGANGERRWRDSRAWFSYQLQDPKQQAAALQLTLFSGDAGRRFQIWFNQQLLTEWTIEAKQDAFYQITVPLPAALVQATTHHQLKFVAAPDSIAGGIYGIRLLKAASEQIADPQKR